MGVLSFYLPVAHHGHERRISTAAIDSKWVNADFRRGGMAMVLSLGRAAMDRSRPTRFLGKLVGRFEKGFAGGLMGTRTGFPDFT